METIMQDRMPILETYLESLASINPSWYTQEVPEKQQHVSTFSDLLDQEYSTTKTAEIQRSNNYEKPLFHRASSPSTQLPLKIEFSPTCGRYLVAMRDITAGEVVFQEMPLILTPQAGAGPTCLSCLKSLREDWNGCKDCGAPLCSSVCSGNGHSEKECMVVGRLGLKETRDVSLIKMLNVWLTPLRTLLISQDNVTVWEVVSALQSNMEKRRKLPIGRFVEEHVVGMLRSRLGLEINSEVIHHICGVFDTNAFEVSLDDCRRGRALFPLGAIMNHSCLPNTQHWYKDGVMTVRAVTDILAGEPITNTYTPILLGTRGRSAHLEVTKLFKCTCKRCLDPTELGSHISSVTCRGCISGHGLMVPPVDPGSDWKCQECENSLPSVAVNTMIRAVGSTASRVPSDDVEALSATLNHLSRLLGNKHYITLELKYALMNAIMQQPLQEITNDDLSKVINLSRDLLQVASFIDPGVSRFRGILLLEKLRASTEQLVRQTNEHSREVQSYPLNTSVDLKIKENMAGATFSDDGILCEESFLQRVKMQLREAAECEMILQYDPKLEKALRVTNLLQSFLQDICT